MSFKRLEDQDFVVSSETITATLWSGGTTTLTTFNTSSTQQLSPSGKYYMNVFQTASTDPIAAVQFAIAYGNYNGSGSSLYNVAVNGASPTRTTYGQYQNLILGDENANFTFGTQTGTEFWAISIDRNRYKEKLFLGSLSLKISGSSGSIVLTDNSLVATSVQFNEAGRVFQLVSGSQGAVYTTLNANGYSLNSGSYGLFLPDIGTILLNPLAFKDVVASGGIGLLTNQSSNSDGLNNQTLFSAISGSSPSFLMNSEETITSDYVFVRSRNAEFNYSENPSFISGSTGEVIYNLFINSPQTYITTVGFYNDNNELLAVAKISRPLTKNFTKESLIRVKLDF